MDDFTPITRIDDFPVTRLDEIPIHILDDIQASMDPNALVNRVFMLDSQRRNVQ